MRVLHVVPSLDPRDGGPSVALPLMARSLATQGISVDVATTITEEDAQAQGIRLNETTEREGFTIRYFERQTSFYKVSLPLLRWLRVHAEDYALLHIHALFSFAPLAGAWAAQKCGVPYVMRPLGLLNRWGMENRRRWMKALSFRLLDRPALNRAAAIHYTSRAEEKEASRLGLRAQPAVVPLGIDLKAYDALPSPQLFLNKFRKAAGKHVILFLSRLDPKKGIESLLDAFASIGPSDLNCVLVIAGKGDATYESHLRQHASRLHLEAHITWAGFLSGDDKGSALAAADLFVLPSQSENFGIALVEALAAGKPCITTEGVALSEDMREREAGIVTPIEDTEALAAAMTRMLTDDALRSRSGTNASRLAAERFSLQAMGEALAALYASVVRQHGSSISTH
jgi:glycosyltransferase involved in cell wall biosynthesis